MAGFRWPRQHASVYRQLSSPEVKSGLLVA